MLKFSTSIHWCKKKKSQKKELSAAHIINKGLVSITYKPSKD